MTLSGSCPGPMTVEISGVTPGATVGVGMSQTPGSFELPSGPCAGTSMDLGLPLRAKRFPVADANGTVSFQASPDAGACGGRVQAVDFATCEVSELLSVP